MTNLIWKILFFVNSIPEILLICHISLFLSRENNHRLSDKILDSHLSLPFHPPIPRFISSKITIPPLLLVHSRRITFLEK